MLKLLTTYDVMMFYDVDYCKLMCHIYVIKGDNYCAVLDYCIVLDENCVCALSNKYQVHIPV